MKAILIMMRKMKGRRHNLSIYTNNEIDNSMKSQKFIDSQIIELPLVAALTISNIIIS